MFGTAGDFIEQRIRRRERRSRRPGFSIVVRPGQEKAPAGMPSKPRIETSSGSRRPASRDCHHGAQRHEVVGGKDGQMAAASALQQPGRMRAACPPSTRIFGILDRQQSRIEIALDAMFVHRAQEPGPRQARTAVRASAPERHDRAT